ncbi:MAG TPA: L-serine ammonia-lyase, iron-sulfur-dependent subunit beta [Thioalkalivibrio sp.]|nr:L-serine ammonia-lyase, iron-sulfur-dependent subunit beta [Thioalkalivibrio sp.]
MKTYRLFDILGPTMIGPSSSHTAGAVKLGRVARALVGDHAIRQVEFFLHGSFAMTYRGHGTDRALLAGLMGFSTWSEDIKNALFIAREKGIEFKFTPTDLGDVHPNTVRSVVLDADGNEYSITGSSIGGGNIRIIAINQDEVDFTGDYPTIIVSHTDVPGVVAEVTRTLYESKINIAFMKVFRSSRGRGATMVFETDEGVTADVLNNLKTLPGIAMVSYLNLEEAE